MTPHRLLVVDNGSTDWTPDLLRWHAERGTIVHLELLNENRGVHYGHNALLEMVESEPFYVSADNDLVPCVTTEEGDWLARLIALGEAHPDYAAIACRPHHFVGDDARRMFKDSPPVKQRGHVGAHLRLMRSDAVRAVGGWSKKVAPSRNNEEKWICGRLRKAGWKVGYSRDVRVIHLWGDPNEGEDYWGYTAGTTHEGHRDVWPPPWNFNWDRQGVDWETCERKNRSG